MAHYSLQLCSFIALCFLSVDARAQYYDNNLDPASSERQFEDNTCRTPDRDVGTCTDIYSCKPIMNLLDTVSQPIPPKVTALLKRYQCGFAGRNPKVCCPSRPIELESTTQTSKRNAPLEPPNVSRHPNLRFLPENCGVLDTDSKISNGEKTGLFDFPWMALLSYGTNRGRQFQCGGTIINDRYILTAAHCVTNIRNSLIGVRVGDHNIRTPVDCQTKYGERVCAPPYQELQIEEVLPHPKFDAKLFVNDIGLIRLRTPMDFSRENIKPVCLPLEKARNYDLTDRNGVVTGWGLTEKGRESPELLKATVPVISREKCSLSYRNQVKFTHEHLCAGGNGGRNSCSGDSGGPLQMVAYMNGDARVIQQGVVSFGPQNCAIEGLPGIYTKVAYYMDWILDNIKP